MDKEPFVFTLPLWGILAITGVWLLAGQLFFVDQWLGGRATNLNEAVAEAEMIQSVVEVSTVTQEAMSGWTVLWPQEMGFSLRTAMQSTLHPWLHSRLVPGIVALLLILLVGAVSENRNGSLHLFGLFFWGWVVELAAMTWVQPPFPVFGSWALISAVAASLLCAGNGRFSNGTSFLARCLGILVLAGFWFQCPANWLGCPVSMHQWLPSAGFAGAWSLTSWFWNRNQD